MKSSQIRREMDRLKFLKSSSGLRIMCRKLARTARQRIGSPYHHTKVPPTLQIEPTNHCNVNCLCCPWERSARKRGYMDFPLYQRIIDDAARIGVERIHLFLLGEPLLHPRLIEMVEYAKSKNLAIYLTTNGMLLKRGLMEGLLRSGMDGNDRVAISVLGYSKEVHERVMRGVNHETVLRNISDFLDLRREYGRTGPAIEVVFYSMPENEDEKSQYIAYWSGRVDRVRADCGISESFSDHKKQRNTTAIRKDSCADLWERMTVFWNGDVTVCNSDVDGEYVVGNLREQSTKEIWNCRQLRSVRKSHGDKQFQDFPLCSKCDW